MPAVLRVSDNRLEQPECLRFQHRRPTAALNSGQPLSAVHRPARCTRTPGRNTPPSNGVAGSPPGSLPAGKQPSHWHMHLFLWVGAACHSAACNCSDSTGSRPCSCCACCKGRAQGETARAFRLRAFKPCEACGGSTQRLRLQLDDSKALSSDIVGEHRSSIVDICC